jgi:hypothetical protein
LTVMGIRNVRKMARDWRELYWKPWSTTYCNAWEGANVIGYRDYSHLKNTIFKVISATILTIDVLWAARSFVLTVVNTIYQTTKQNAASHIVQNEPSWDRDGLQGTHGPA